IPKYSELLLNSQGPRFSYCIGRRTRSAGAGRQDRHVTREVRGVIFGDGGKPGAAPLIAALLACAAASGGVQAQSVPNTEALKKLSLEDLSSIQVYSASRRLES